MGSSDLEEQRCRSSGKVYLVGAGPGDPELITLKGLRAISKADVILVDRLVPKEILGYSRPGAEIIYVGKEPGSHAYTQEEINKIMIMKAIEGKIVVRLKGGDPLVFGRGGEEMEALREAGVCYEVIPGVSSVYAVPAYAGIPITHRRISSSVAITTGREAEEKEERRVDLKAISRAVDTIVILMGISKAEEISRELLEADLSPETPVAVIERGTTDEQRVLITNLEKMHIDIANYQIKNPAIIVVGKTAILSKKLCWYQCDKIIDNYHKGESVT
ncbi:MAG: uroporphyrinogen-III C-methyltransferase [Desulfurococcales archaeon]|jgi:uroporphyrin-III C-methyltransferase|nr:uroporphyrinogen-III C-methyltransferase [Desulfurococcales archaeon]